jgi:hypothetical protein
MSDVEWQQHNHAYTASISDFRAVIAQQHDTDTFTAWIETVGGEPLQVYEALPDFETAVWCVLSAVVEAEQTLDKHKPYQRIFETLDLCKAKLSTAAHPVHVQRLEYIRQWVATQRTQEEEIADEWRQRADEPQATTALDWQALNATDWYVDTLHGRAIIRELRADTSRYGYATTIRHTAWIAHPSGARYDWNTTSIDFMVADAWVQQTLRELDEPRIAEQFLGNITFTLSICLQLLVDEPDPMHSARVEYIKVMLETVLP